MAEENVKVCGGLLVVKSESGTAKVKKVLVETRPGRRKNEIKCRIQKFAEEKFPAKIAALIVPRRKEDNSIKSLHSSLINFQSKKRPDFKNFISSSSGDFLNVGKSKDIITGKTEETFTKQVFQTSMKEKIVKKENYESIDDDIVSSPNQSEEMSTDEEKDSTIHLAYEASSDEFESEDEEFNFPKKTKKAQPLDPKQPVPPDPKEKLQSSEDEGSENEDQGSEQDSHEQSSSGSTRSYLDSGLRRLKSEQSRLRIDRNRYKKRRNPPKKKVEPPPPMLPELSSDLFKKTQKQKQEEIEPPPSLTSKEESSDNDLDTDSESSEESDDIDEEPLHRLREIGDKKFKFDDVIPLPVEDRKEPKQVDPTPDEDTKRPKHVVPTPKKDRKKPKHVVLSPDEDTKGPKQVVPSPDEDTKGPKHVVPTPKKDRKKPKHVVPSPDEDAKRPKHVVPSPKEDTKGPKPVVPYPKGDAKGSKHVVIAPYPKKDDQKKQPLSPYGPIIEEMQSPSKSNNGLVTPSLEEAVSGGDFCITHTDKDIPERKCPHCDICVHVHEDFCSDSVSNQSKSSSAHAKPARSCLHTQDGASLTSSENSSTLSFLDNKEARRFKYSMSKN